MASGRTAMSLRYLFFAGVFLTRFASGATGVSDVQVLTLKGAIERAMISNPDLKENLLELKSSELTYDDAWDRMYMPQISLAVSSGAAKTITGLAGDSGSILNHGYPSSSAGLSLGEYTLYNFGRDKLVFDQAKLDWDRNREIYEEQRRAVRFSVVNAFWTLKSRLDKLDGYERSVEIASAVVRLLESRAMIGKAAATDVSSSTVDLLNIKNLRDQTSTDAKSALYSLNVLLGDEVGTPYRIEEEIQFLPIKVTEEVLVQTYLKDSPNIKNARKDLLKSHLSLELTEKSLLPLPTIKFSGVTLGYGNNIYGGKLDSYTAAAGQKNFDISASVSLSVPLTGPGGLFSSRTVEASRITRDTSEIRLANTVNKDRQQIFDYIQKIRQYEGTVENNRESYNDSISVLESVLDGFISHKNVTRLDVRDAINQARDRQAALSDALLEHLYNKTLLAGFIGVDYLPRME